LSRSVAMDTRAVETIVLSREREEQGNT